MFKLKKYGRSLGIATKKRDYDLPLNKGAGGQFLMILIALMSFLAVLALTASFALSEMTHRWTSGLENKASIEIPAEDVGGRLLDSEQLSVITTKTHNFLKTHPAVNTAEIMSNENISKLVSPWLGEDMEFGDIPLPAIITVHFKENVVFDITSLQENIKDIAPQARLDTHESWLKNVLRFTGALNFSATLVSLIIGVTTIVAIGGAVQSRMAVYREELELLHLMGASDNYISNQLQRYVFIIAFKGAFIGVLSSAFVLTIIGWFMGRMDINLIPDFSLSTIQIILLGLLIPITAMIGMITARHTVLRALTLMP